jgi:hypothetical protein
MITALIYGERPSKIIEKFLSHPHIKAEKNQSHELAQSLKIASSFVVSAPGTGITESNL